MTPSDPNQPNNRLGQSPELKKKAESFFAGDMSEAERTAFERDMAENPELARNVYEAMGMGPVFHEAIQALRVRQLESHARIANGTISKQVPWWGRTRSRLVLTVVTAALVFLVVSVSNIGVPPIPERPPQPLPTEGFRGLSPVGDVPALPVQFICTAHPAASQFRFEIFDESSQPVYSTLTSGTSLVIAVDDLADRGFRGGNWRVISLDRHGAELESSVPVEIRVSPR